MTEQQAYSWLTQPGIQATLFSHDRDTDEALRVAINHLKDAPKVGRWLPTTEEDTVDPDESKCSICGAVHLVQSDWLGCPSCFSRIDFATIEANRK